MKYEKKVQYISLAAGITLLLVLPVYFVSQNLVVRSIQIEIEKSLAWDDQAVQALHGRLAKKLKVFESKKIKDISLKKMIQIVQSEPRVGSAAVVRLLPRRLLVKVKVRQPLLVLLDHKNRMHPLSIDGALLPPLSQAPDLPIVRGIEFFKQKRLRLIAAAFIQKLALEGAFSRRSVSEMGYTKLEDSLYFILSDGGQITTGLSLQPIQINRIESVLQYLKQQNIKWRVIDVRFSQKIVVSTAQAI